MNENYLKFLGNCLQLYDLYKFDKLCPDIPFTDKVLENALTYREFSTLCSFGYAVYNAIFDCFIDDLINTNKVTKEEAQDLEMQLNPVEFYYKDYEFETMDELLMLIEKERDSSN